MQSGTLSEMRHLTRTTVQVELSQPAASLEAMDGIHDLRQDDGTITFAVDGSHIDEAVRQLSQLGVRSLVAHPPTLEELMLRHYGDELGANGAGEPSASGSTTDSGADR